jgi:hypothetical protein
MFLALYSFILKKNADLSVIGLSIFNIINEVKDNAVDNFLCPVIQIGTADYSCNCTLSWWDNS